MLGAIRSELTELAKPAEYEILCPAMPAFQRGIAGRSGYRGC